MNATSTVACARCHITAEQYWDHRGCNRLPCPGSCSRCTKDHALSMWPAPLAQAAAVLTEGAIDYPGGWELDTLIASPAAIADAVLTQWAIDSPGRLPRWLRLHCQRKGLALTPCTDQLSLRQLTRGHGLPRRPKVGHSSRIPLPGSCGVDTKRHESARWPPQAVGLAGSNSCSDNARDYRTLAGLPPSLRQLQC